MKNIFTIIALGSIAFVSADQYRPYESREDYQSSRNNEGCYQNQPNNSNYYQQNPRQNPQGYYQNPQGYHHSDDRNYQRNNQSNYQQAPMNQSSQNQQYYPRRGEISYTDQERTYADSSDSQNGISQGNASDQELYKKIKGTLSSGWFSKGFQNVSFDINNGNVTLKGSVDTLENKNKVEEGVRTIDGVRQVTNQIKIVEEKPYSYSESQLQDSERKYSQDTATNSQDRQLNAKIRNELNNGWFSKGYETLVIKTSNGVVVISGTVDKPEDIQKISDQIKGIDGVKSVNNQLKMRNE